MKLLIMSSLSLLALSGCTYEKTTLMKNPKTGEIAQCQAIPDWTPQVAQCVTAYKAEGYVQVSDGNTK